MLFSPLEISRETEPNADELFDKCGDFDGVITDHCSVSDWRGPEVNFEENKKDFSCSQEELADFKDAFFCVTSVAMGTDLSGVQYVKLTRRTEVFPALSMSDTLYVEVTVPDNFEDVRLLSFCVPSTDEFTITGVFDVESFDVKYPVALLSLTVDVWVDK